MNCITNVWSISSLVFVISISHEVERGLQSSMPNFDNIFPIYLDWIILIVSFSHSNCIPKNEDNFPRSVILNVECNLVWICIRCASVFDAMNISSAHNKMMDIWLWAFWTYMQGSTGEYTKFCVVKYVRNVLFQVRPLCFNPYKDFLSFQT